MGYESKLIVGLRYHNTTMHNSRDFCAKILELDLSHMNDTRFENSSKETIFTKKIDFDLYREDGSTVYNKDCYGDACGYTDIKTVIDALTDYSKNREYYRRADLALKVLKSFKLRDWNRNDYAELVVVHFGH